MQFHHYSNTIPTLIINDSNYVHNSDNGLCIQYISHMHIDIQTVDVWHLVKQLTK